MEMEELEMWKGSLEVNWNESISNDNLSSLVCRIVGAMCVEWVYIVCLLCYSLLHQPETYKVPCGGH